MSYGVTTCIVVCYDFLTLPLYFTCLSLKSSFEAGGGEKGEGGEGNINAIIHTQVV